MHRLNRGGKWICLILGVFSAPIAASSQDATLSGTVTDTTSFVLPGVTVEARDAAGDQAGTAVTDGAGLFTISLPPGTYQVTFTLPGFQDAARDAVEVGAGAAVTLDVELAVDVRRQLLLPVGVNNFCRLRGSEISIEEGDACVACGRRLRRVWTPPKMQAFF